MLYVKGRPRGCAGCGADPFAVVLPPLDHVPDLLGGVRDGHLVDQELKLNFQPVIIVRKVDAVTDGNDPHPRIPQILQLHQSPAVPPRESGEVLHHQNIDLVGHHLPAHFLVVFPLLKGVTGAVAVFKEGKAASGKFGFYKICDDGFLVFNGYIAFVCSSSTEIRV